MSENKQEKSEIITIANEMVNDLPSFKNDQEKYYYFLRKLENIRNTKTNEDYIKEVCRLFCKKISTKKQIKVTHKVGKDSYEEMPGTFKVTKIEMIDKAPEGLKENIKTCLETDDIWEQNRAIAKIQTIIFFDYWKYKNLIMEKENKNLISTTAAINDILEITESERYNKNFDKIFPKLTTYKDLKF